MPYALNGGKLTTANGSVDKKSRLFVSLIAPNKTLWADHDFLRQFACQWIYERTCGRMKTIVPKTILSSLPWPGKQAAATATELTPHVIIASLNLENTVIWGFYK